jgi:cation diffusion facilitator CzcD-associated flavoprotein CzcO
MTWAVQDVDVAIIGAGPHGLSAALHLRRAGVDAQVFGDPMSFWRTMPAGMHLRSNWSATNIAEPVGDYSLDAYKAATGDEFGSPVPLDKFVAYGSWFQEQAVTGVDRRLVTRLDRTPRGFALELADGERVHARRVVAACGIAPFAWRPPGFDHLPPDLVSHSGERPDLSVFAGRRVAVVGGGQSALESAALMQERGAHVEVFIRRADVIWLRANSPKNMLGPLGPIVYAPTDVGPLWYSRLVAAPRLFRRLPRRAQDRIAYRSIRPACSNWVRVRLDDVGLTFNAELVSADADGNAVRVQLADGSAGRFDHLMFGTGYRVDVARYPWVTAGLLGSLRRIRGYPELRSGMESSVPGLHFIGAPAAYSFGPTMRFVSGSWYCGRSLARALGGERSGVA